MNAEQRRTEALLNAHGRTITFLRLTHHHLPAQAYLDRCPALDHLIVKFIHVFVSPEDISGDELASWKDRLPSLRRYRRLEFGMSILRDVPLTFEGGEDGVAHPEEADDGEIKRPTITAPENLPMLLGFTDGAVNGPPAHWVDNSDDYVKDSDADCWESDAAAESEAEAEPDGPPLDAEGIAEALPEALPA
ncbi:hypothetical protein C8R47DRAFT_1066149 [Mycena vitilis]|nr:hypothetical protein C8R47DRAFT_1066149 [Mycena vitilis]